MGKREGESWFELGDQSGKARRGGTREGTGISEGGKREGACVRGWKEERGHV